MSTVIAAGADQSMLLRLAAAIQEAGHSCALLPTSSFERGTGFGAGVCLYDLGQQPSTDQDPLLNAITTNPLSRFVALTARPNADEGLRLLRSGARGYCNRLLSTALLGAVVAAVEQGEVWAGHEVTTHLLDQGIGERQDRESQQAELLTQLTPREAAVARRVAAGASNKMIAIDSGITERTVKAHLHSIFRKLGVRNRVQLALTLANVGPEHRVQSSG